MSTVRTVFSQLSQSVMRVVRALENRRAAKALRYLDSRNLADIGLTRDAVESVFANTSLIEDPTTQLSRIAARRGLQPAGRESAPSPAREAGAGWTGALPATGPAALA